MSVFSEKKIKKIHNVISVIRGEIEPDRYVMVGNHRDSWTFGSIDPSSATSVLLEVSRSLSELRKNSNWLPKRSILFLSWDAEEYGLIGSTEWVEEFYKKLTANGIVYINCDNAVQGTFSYEAKASPQLHKLLVEVTKNIRYDDKLSIFDRWLENNPNEDGTWPKINSNLGSGSDHAVFLQRLGIPCIDQKFVRYKKEEKFKNIFGYPLYHTSYETFELVERYMDPEFFALTSITKVIGETTRVLSDSLILPFDLENYHKDIKNQIKLFDKQYGLRLNKFNISLNNLAESIENLGKNVKNFNDRLNQIDKSKYHLVRQFNEQMKNFERSFLDVYYLETGSMHTLYAPSSMNKYVGNSFPGVVESIIKLDDSQSFSEDLIENIRVNLAILINSIQSASHTLKDPADFS
ncbi:N-acetylated-alpha-linked acidic dipeptidase 2 isoform X2, partial [Brachionus plicatilis]